MTLYVWFYTDNDENIYWITFELMKVLQLKPKTLLRKNCKEQRGGTPRNTSGVFLPHYIGQASLKSVLSEPECS